MTRRAARISRLMLESARRKLRKSTIKYKNLKTYVKNAQNLLKVERTRMGTDASFQQGSCIGNTCYRGIMMKVGNGGDEETWICRRGMKSKKNTRATFSCTHKKENGAMDMCVGKELWFGQFWVPMMKEIHCPKDLLEPCRESRQCGSEGLPLTKDYMQTRMRNECVQL